MNHGAYDGTDTQRAAERVLADMNTLTSNEEAAAWDGYATAAFPTITLRLEEDDCDDVLGCAAHDCASFADAMLRERRRRLVAGRVDQRLTPAEQAVIDAAIGWEHTPTGSANDPAATIKLGNAVHALLNERSRP